MNYFTEVDGPKLLAECGTDATKWAEAFNQIVIESGVEIDEGLMQAWFANVIMNTHDIITGQGPVVLPDGSAFVTGAVGRILSNPQNTKRAKVERGESLTMKSRTN